MARATLLLLVSFNPIITLNLFLLKTENYCLNVQVALSIPSVLCRKKKRPEKTAPVNVTVSDLEPGTEAACPGTFWFEVG